MKCPNCKTKLLRLPVKNFEGIVKDLWLHPETIKKCDYQDGVRVTTEMIDQRLSDKFQELVAESNIFKRIISIFK